MKLFHIAVMVIGVVCGCDHAAEAGDREISTHMARARIYAAEARAHARMGEVLLANGNDDAASREFAMALAAHEKQMEEQDKALALQKAAKHKNGTVKVALPLPPSAK